MLELLTLANFVGAVSALVTGTLLRNHFIMTEAERKTNIPFIDSYNLVTGSRGIVFANDKTASINAEDWANKLGVDTFGCFFGQNMQIITRDPDLAYKILVQRFQQNHNRILNSLSKYFRASLLEARDTEWQTTRRAIGSVLRASKLKVDNVELNIDSNVAKMVDSVDRRMEKLKQENKEPVLDVLEMNKNFVMQSLLNIVFDTHDMVDFDKEENEIVADMTTFVTVNYEFIVRACFLVPALTFFVRPIAGFFNHGKFMNKLVDKLDVIIKKSQQNIGFDKTAGKEAATRVKSTPQTTIHSLVQAYQKGEMDEAQLKGNSFFLMMASYTTIVDLMSVFLWTIARHQDRQDKLREELISCGENSPYLDQCLNETMRLYPAASITNRGLGEDIYHHGGRFLKGALLNVNIWGVHHNAKYWGPDVEEWNPERFNKDKAELFHPGQFLPFGLGPRNCVGYHFARLEITKLSAQLLLRYKFEVCSETQDKISILALGAFPFTLPVEGPVWLKVTHAN